jgi:hypothetical protein
MQGGYRDAALVVRLTAGSPMVEDGAMPNRESSTTNPYRMSRRRITTWTGALIASVVLLVVVAVVLAAIGGDSAESWVAIVLFVAFGVPVAAAAVLGGLAIASWGWVAGTVFGVGWLTLLVVVVNNGFHLLFDGQAVGPVIYDEAIWQVVGVAGLVVGGVLFFVAGWGSGVPMWIGGPAGGVDVSRRKRSGEGDAVVPPSKRKPRTKPKRRSKQQRRR